MNGIRRVGVIGLGTMGHGIAQEFAVFGFQVVAYEEDSGRAAAALESIRRNLETLELEGLLPAGQAGEVVNRIGLAPAAEEVAASTDYIVEAIPEVLEPKQRLIARLSEFADRDVILATNTSGLDPTEIAKQARYPERFIATHYWNPPHLLPLVEITRAEQTSDETVVRTLAVLERTQKTPVVLKRYVPGFIGNRLQWALFREALSLVENGIAEPEDVDRVMANSLGRRWSIVGPFETADMGGLDVHLAVGTYLLKVLDTSTSPSPALKEKVAEGNFGLKTGRGFYEWTAERRAERCQQRDRRLLDLLAADRKST